MYYYTSSSKLESSSSVLSSRFDIDGVWPAIVAVSAPSSQTDFIHCVQFTMQLSCLRSVLCVSHRLLSDLSSPPVVQLYPEIQYVRM